MSLTSPEEESIENWLPKLFSRLNEIKSESSSTLFDWIKTTPFAESSDKEQELLQLTEKAKDVWGSNYRLNQIDIINVNFNTLDEFCKENSVNFIDFLKLDVQGAEFKVLKGAHKSLMEKKIKVIQLEVIISKTYVGQKSLAYYIELLEGYGYKLINFSDFTFVKGELVQTDLF